MSVTNANKYDRQIRVWGDDGQAALQRASVCVINASATATELLKNLVLPGIGAFTIVDATDVSPVDRAANFFLTTPASSSSSNGQQPIPPQMQKRAYAVAAAMHELNESVRGSYITADPASFLNSVSAARNFLRRFSVVVLSQMSMLSRVVRAVADACQSLNLPLVFVRSYGLVAHLRLQLPEHCVRDARTADAPPDLRLHHPFDELTHHAASAAAAAAHEDGIAEGDAATAAAHTPFVIILARAVAQYRKNHDGALPNSRAEKDAFASLVRAMPPPDCPSDAQNFAEALRFANLRLCHASAADLPAALAAVLRDPKTDDVPATSAAPDNWALFSTVASDGAAATASTDNSHNHDSFPEAVRFAWRDPPPTPMTDARHIARQNARWWLCATACRKFWQAEKSLPLSGRIPDMTADTPSYIKLQRVYAERAQLDARCVWRFVGELAERRGVDIDMDFDAVAAYCKCVRDVCVVRSRSISDEVSGAAAAGGFAEAARMDGGVDAACANTVASPFYAALRAVDFFEREHGRLPGVVPAMHDADVALMHEFVPKVREDLALGSAEGAAWREVVEEVVRFGGVETHCVAAFIGGIAAQEVTKIVTGQFVPLSDTLVFNMATMTSVTFRS